MAGVLGCWDRVVVQGTLPGLCFAEGMTSYLSAHGIRIFDYPRWAEPLRDAIRDNAERLAQQHGVAIEFVRKHNMRKEERIKQVLAERGEHPGLVHILSAMEACASYKPWHDKITHRTFLKPDTGKCLHYYFYFIDEELGLTYVRADLVSVSLAGLLQRPPLAGGQAGQVRHRFQASRQRLRAYRRLRRCAEARR